MKDYVNNRLMPFITRVRTMCNAGAIPLVFDNSLSYYEQLCAFTHKLNEIIATVNNQNILLCDFMNQLSEAFKELSGDLNSEWQTIFQEYTATVNVQINGVKNDIRDLDIRVTALENQPIGGGVGEFMPAGNVEYEGYTYTVGENAERFNLYGGTTPNLAAGSYSHAEGQETAALYTSSHAEGAQTAALAISAHAEGGGTRANGAMSHAEGEGTIASLASCHAEGKNTRASGLRSHAEGLDSVASGAVSHAENKSTASGDYSHSEGLNTSASADQAHSEGNATLAAGANSHAEGYNTTCYSPSGHAEGYQTRAGNEVSPAAACHAEGTSTIASGVNSHAEGSGSYAYGANSHAEGTGCTAAAEAANSHVQGAGNIVSAPQAFAGGAGCTASGANSVALGSGCTASGAQAFAIGTSCEAAAANSAALGIGTIAGDTKQFVIGKYNVYHDDQEQVLYAFIIGNGTTDARADLFKIGFDGLFYFGASGTGIDIPDLSSEIITARGSYANLNARLDAMSGGGGGSLPIYTSTDYTVTFDNNVDSTSSNCVGFSAGKLHQSTISFTCRAYQTITDYNSFHIADVVMPVTPSGLISGQVIGSKLIPIYPTSTSQAQEANYILLAIWTGTAVALYIKSNGITVGSSQWDISDQITISFIQT